MTTTPAPTVRNITRLFRTATPDQIADGINWYADAHLVADALATRYDVTIEVACGVIAALSPLQSWGANVNLAARFLDQGGLHEGYLKANLAKARDILAGADITKTLSGWKIVNFYRAILTSGTEGVVIDRHAWSLAVNTRYADKAIPSINPTRYSQAAQAYRRAADILSKEYGPLTPAQVQATTWILWRNKFWSEGAFDHHEVEL